MPRGANPFRTFRAASRIQTYAPRTFRASTQPFQPKPFLSASSIRTFSSSFQRFSIETPPSQNETQSQNAPSQESSSPAVHRPVYDSAGVEPKVSGRKPLYESANNQPPTPPRGDVPSYEMTITCKPCSTRSTHRISKQGYHHGSVLITCPECRNRHIVSDHLKVFGDKGQGIEDFMKENGELVKKGTLNENGDMEFWDDGTSTERVRLDGPK